MPRRDLRAAGAAIALMAVAASPALALTSRRAGPDEEERVRPAASQAKAAATTVSDELAYSIQIQSIEGADGGGGIGASWLRRWRPTLLTELGGYHHGVADSGWSFARVGVTSRWRGLWLTGRAGLGGGQTDGEGFSYVDLRASVGRSLLSGRLAAQVDLGHYDIDDFRGGVVQLAVDANLGSTVAMRLLFTNSVGGDLSVHTATGQLSLRRGRLTLLAGATGGRYGTVLPRASSADYAALFIGLRDGPTSSVLAFDRQRIGETDRSTLLLAGRIPLP